MNYPGRIIKKEETDKKIVRAIQARLNELNFGPLTVDGDFGIKTGIAIKAFQAQSSDTNGQQLVIDGQLGPISWAALFGQNQVPVNTEPKTAGLTDVIDIARAEVGVQEMPLNTNRGPRVEEFQRTVGCGPGDAWCACFVYWCFNQAAKNIGKKNPLVKTGGAQASYNLATTKKILPVEARNNPALIQPGQIFVLSFGGGKGHTGIITAVNGGFITTIEGNTNDQGGREGSGVFQRTRKINSVNKGFLEYKL